MNRRSAVSSIRWGRSRRRDERGAALILGALFAVVSIVGAALAVDIGRVVLEKRGDQRVADMVALDAARGFLTAPDNPRPAVNALAAASAARNGYDPSDAGSGHSLLVELVKVTPLAGNYTVVVIPDTGVSTIDATANAVRVTLTSTTRNIFAAGDKALKAVAIGALGNGTTCILPCNGNDNSPIGTVRVGSTLASLNTTDTKILNAIMTQLVGGTVNLDAVGWKGIGSGYVTLSSLQTALGMTALSPDQFLASTVSYGDLLTATIAALQADGSQSSIDVASSVTQIKSAFNQSLGLQVPIGKLISIAGSAGNGQDVADMAVSVRHLVEGGAIVADSDHFLTFDLLAPNLPVIPNIQKITVSGGLVEAPQQKIGQYGKDSLGNYRTTATTAQIRFLVDVVLAVPLGGLLGVQPVHIPYYIEGGSGAASLDTAHCSAQTPDSVDIMGVTSALGIDVARVSQADLSSASGSTITKGQATLVDVAGLVKVTARAGIGNVIAGGSKLVSFSPSYDGLTSQQVPGSALSLPTVAAADMNVQVLGLIGVSGATLATTISQAIAAAAPQVQNTVLAGLSKATGLTFGQADVWAPSAQKCQTTSFTTEPVTTVVSIPTLIK